MTDSQVDEVTPLEGQLPDDETTEESAKEGQEPTLKSMAVWSEAKYSAEEKKSILDKYAHVDSGRVMNRNLLNDAILFFTKHRNKIKNQKHIAVIDFSRNSRYARLFIVDLETGSIKALHVAHGSGSDTNNDGNAEKFSNVPNSKCSSLGFYLTGETYSGKHGLSRRLDGVSPTNSKARERAVVIHGAKYVLDRDIRPGRSWGCPAVSMANRDYVVKTLTTGSLIYAARPAQNT